MVATILIRCEIRADCHGIKDELKKNIAGDAKAAAATTASADEDTSKDPSDELFTKTKATGAALQTISRISFVVSKNTALPVLLIMLRNVY